MTDNILKQVFRHLDSLELFDYESKQGITPFVLVYGHDSRFHIDLLEYTKSEYHKWTVSIVVPYRTAYWHVGDIKEQN